MVHRGSAREQYYEREIADDREFYYAGAEGTGGGDEGEPVGRWTGQGASALGLEGEVDLDGLRQMWQGRCRGPEISCGGCRRRERCRRLI